MFAVTTSYDLGVDATKVKISWVVPYDNSAAITGYQIIIQANDLANFFEDKVNCDGNQDPVKSSLSCFIPLTVLRAAPYSLEFNDLVVAKARAKNIWGFGAYSENNTAGAYIQTEPNAPASPVLDIALSTLTSIKLDWPALTGLSTGQSPITSYNL